LKKIRKRQKKLKKEERNLEPEKEKPPLFLKKNLPIAVVVNRKK
jgi:hypothetical protein